MSFILTKHVIKALVTTNKEGNEYTIFPVSEKGGPIVTANTEEEAREKFEIALSISSAIRNFMFFKGANSAQSQIVRKGFIENMKERSHEIEYVKQVA